MKSLLLVFLVLASNAFAEVPPPGKARKGPITVTPEGMDTHEYDLSGYKVIPREDSRKVQKKIDALRARIKQLEAQLDQKPAPVIHTRTMDKIVRIPDTKKHRVALYGGVAPDGVHVDAKDKERKAELHETGTAIGASYAYKFSDNWSINAFGSVTTRSTYIPSGYIGLGYDF